MEGEGFLFSVGPDFWMGLGMRLGSTLTGLWIYPWMLLPSYAAFTYILLYNGFFEDDPKHLL